MKVIWCVAVVACFLGQGFSAEPARVSGKVVDCWNGKTLEVRRIDVFAFHRSSDTELWDSLERLTHLSRSGDLKKFVVEYGRLEESIKKRTAWVAHIKTNKNGRFSFETLKKKSDLVVLAISFNVEDDLSYYTYQALKPGERSVTLWMEKGTCEAGASAERDRN